MVQTGKAGDEEHRQVEKIHRHMPCLSYHLPGSDVPEYGTRIKERQIGICQSGRHELDPLRCRSPVRTCILLFTIQE